MLMAQLSDVHVRPRGQLYKGVADSNRMLSEAIAHLQGLDRRPDVVLLTGDLVEEGRPDEYSTALEILGELTIPYLVIPGNHDDRENFRTAFESHAYLPRHGPLHYCIEDHPIRIVALDSCPPGRHHGHIDSTGLGWLRATLEADSRKPTVVIMHHPPFVSGIGKRDHLLALKQPLHFRVQCCGDSIPYCLARFARTVNNSAEIRFVNADQLGEPVLPHP